jgi:hypothetical protein
MRKEFNLSLVGGYQNAKIGDIASIDTRTAGVNGTATIGKKPVEFTLFLCMDMNIPS